MFIFLLNDAEKAIARSFKEDTDNWEIDSHYARHKTTGLILQVHGGPINFDFPSGSGKYPSITSKLGRFILWYYFKKLLTFKIENNLKIKSNNDQY